MRARIVVNRHIAKANRDKGRDDPPLSVQTSKGIRRAKRIRFLADGKEIGVLIYAPDNPLKCGATIYFETDTSFLEVE